jgi:hypothetical protein
MRLARRLGALSFEKAVRLMMCDVETDFLCVASIVRSIDGALVVAEAERSGLNSRIDDALARAAVTSGNDFDEYLTRDSLDSHNQNLLDTEISDGRLRLEQLSENIKHFRFLKEVLLTRFPDFKMVSDRRGEPVVAEFLIHDIRSSNRTRSAASQAPRMSDGVAPKRRRNMRLK